MPRLSNLPASAGSILVDSSTIEQCDPDPTVSLKDYNDVAVESSENLLKIKELLYPRPF